MNLDHFGRVRLAHLPTPLEPLSRLSAALGGPRIYVKRDDQTGLALGGNKVRKLEFLMADAVAQGCDTVVTTGGPQSNHARQTAAAAARLGLACELVLPRIVPNNTPEYEQSGNVLLDHLFGAKVSLRPAAEFNENTVPAACEALVSQGRRPYAIPVGGSTARGALGYANAAHELLAQAREQDLQIDAIFVPTGSSGTHAGILAGLMQAGCDCPLRGVAVSGTGPDKQALVERLCRETLGLLGISDAGLSQRVHVDGGYVGPGYGMPTDAMLEAVRLTARLEGLLLDPVYTGKAMAGLIEAVRRGVFPATANVVFWHTGGTPALFAYQSTLQPALA